MKQAALQRRLALTMVLLLHNISLYMFFRARENKYLKEQVRNTRCVFCTKKIPERIECRTHKIKN